jgi:predicted lipoprotein with Yx(FWY)xxD motif
MSKPAKIVRRAALALLATFLLAAGMVGARLGTSPAAPREPVPAADPSQATVPALFGISSDRLGWIVIDVQGYVLYRYDGDSPSPSRSTCVDACAERWLPVPAAQEIRVEGIDRQLVGTVLRPDGSRQLTLAGWPLYGYSRDRMPGDTDGHGVDRSWFAVTPAGAKAGLATSPP